MPILTRDGFTLEWHQPHAAIPCILASDAESVVRFGAAQGEQWSFYGAPDADGYFIAVNSGAPANWRELVGAEIGRDIEWLPMSLADVAEFGPDTAT